MKKSITIFGAVTITLLMISSATAVTIQQANESIESESIVNEQINYVNPDIYLSGLEQMNILLDALNFVDNPDVYLLLQEIIAVMETKGYVNSDDIEQIINDNDLEVGTITFGQINTGGPADPSRSGGIVGLCPRRPLCFGILVIPFSSFLYFCTYDQNDPNIYPHIPCQITIAGKYEGNPINWGFTVGFIGVAGREWGGVFQLHGAALLIIYSGQEQQQSNPTPQQSQSQTQPSTEPSSTTTTQTMTSSTRLFGDTTSR